jgi:hypothetical protein
MLDLSRRPPWAARIGVSLMLGRLARAASLLLFGWFVFVIGAVAYAKIMGRAPVTPEPDADEIDLVVTFGPMEFASTAASFRGGSVTTWFGGGTLDLRGARLDPAGATLRTNTLFGGGNLVVPDDWRVETKILPIFGGVGDGRPDGNPPEGGPTLRLEGVAIFGGWSVTSEPAGEELVTA